MSDLDQSSESEPKDGESVDSHGEEDDSDLNKFEHDDFIILDEEEKDGKKEKKKHKKKKRLRRNDSAERDEVEKELFDLKDDIIIDPNEVE